MLPLRRLFRITRDPSYSPRAGSISISGRVCRLVRSLLISPQFEFDKCGRFNPAMLATSFSDDTLHTPSSSPGVPYDTCAGKVHLYLRENLLYASDRRSVRPQTWSIRLWMINFRSTEPFLHVRPLPLNLIPLLPASAFFHLKVPGPYRLSPRVNRRPVFFFDAHAATRSTLPPPSEKTRRQFTPTSASWGIAPR